MKPYKGVKILIFLLMCIFSFSAYGKNKEPGLTLKVQNIIYSAQKKIEKKDYEGAEEILLKFIEKNQKESHYLVEFTLGNVLALKGENEEALFHYRESTRLYSDYGHSWQNLGKVYFDLKRYDKAGDCLIKGYELSDKKDLSLIYWASCSYIMAKKEKKALSHLEYLVTNKKCRPETRWYEALLNVYMQLNLTKKALKTVYNLLCQEEGNPIWWKFLANIYLQQNDYKRALCAMTVYSYLTPLTSEEITLLGELNNIVGLPLQAAKYYEDIIASGKKPSDYKRLALAYISGHKPEKAKNILEKALKEKPASEFWSILGQVLYKEEKFDEAYIAFKQSAKLNPEDGKAYLMMGYCAFENGRKNEAKNALKKAAKFSKYKKTAKKLLKHIALFSDDKTQH